MSDDNDLRALREFRVELDEPRDGGLARGRYRLAREDARPPARRRQWLLASAGAAAAVAVVVAAASLLGGPGAGGGDKGEVAAPPSVAPTPAKSSAPAQVMTVTAEPGGALG